MLLHIRRFTIAQLVARRLRLGWVLWIFFPFFFLAAQTAPVVGIFRRGMGEPLVMIRFW